MQNIGFDNMGDINYRYQMPKMVIKVEGKGNGIKTIIVNLNDISKALNREPDIIIKYFSYSLGSITEKNNIIKGPHKLETLNELLNKFIEKYVLCSFCSNPETTYTFDNNMLTIDCIACGHIQKADNSKIVDYVIKKFTK
jgi:translation initiation factor 5